MTCNIKKNIVDEAIILLIRERALIVDEKNIQIPFSTNSFLSKISIESGDKIYMPSNF
jgi:hypothetical protein